MPLTIQDLLDPLVCPDGFVVPKLSGTVKVAFKVKPAESRGDQTFGQQQGFVLVNPEGEITCNLKDTENGGGFSPVSKGDQVEIFATPHGKTGAPSGNKLRSYQKDGKTCRILDVFGLKHLKNLTQPAGTQPAYTAVAGSSAPPQATAPFATGRAAMGEAEAVETYWRLFGALAAHFSPKVSASATTLEGFLIEADTALLDLVHRGAVTLLLAELDGKIVPAPKPTTAKNTDPAWMRD